MNVRLPSYTTLALAVALAAGCSGQSVDTSNTILGSSIAGNGASSGGAAGRGAGQLGSGGANQGTTGGTSSEQSAAGALGHAGSAAQSNAGFGGGASGGGASGFAAAGGHVSSGGASYAGSAGSGGSNSNAGGFSGQNGAGASNADAGSGGSSSMPVPATWDTVKLVLSGTRPPCNGCHGNIGDGGFRINLNNDSQTYSSLLKTTVKDCNNNPIVTPGDPTKSALITVLQSGCDANVPRMPPGCTDADGTCLPPEYMTALEQWITNGAPEP